MKGFKKGIALIAVLAFLITAVMPAAVLAAAEPMSAPEARAAVVVNNSATVTIERTANMPTDASYYRLETSDNTPDAPNLTGKYTFTVEGNQVIIDIEEGALDKVGDWQYRLYFIQAATGFPMTLGTITINVVPGQSTDTYKVTLEPAEPENGAVTLDPAEAQTEGVAAGTYVTVTAEPAEGYGLKSITAEPEVEDLDITGNGASFTMPAEDVSLTVEFAKAYEIDTENAPSWLMVPDSTAVEGAVVTVQANPDQIEDGTGIAGLKVTDADGNEIPLTYVSPTEYTFVMPASDVSITAAEQTEPVPEMPEDGYPVEAPSGVTADVSNAKPGDTVTITVEPDEDGNYPEVSATANGTAIALVPVLDAEGKPTGQYTFTMPAGRVTITTGGSPEPVVPELTTPGIIDGKDYLDGTSLYDPFTYWTQPAAGLFSDGEVPGTDKRPTADVPRNTLADPVRFQIGPDNLGGLTPGVALSPSGYTDTLELNSRIQIYYNPDNIFVDDDNNPATPPKQLGECNWEDYVTMEWEYKPSTNNEDDGNPLKIPTGLGFSGVRSPLLTISPLTANMDGWWVRLAVYPKGANNTLYWTTRWIRIDINGVNSAYDPTVTLTSTPEAVGSMVNVTRGGEAVLTAIVANQPYGSSNEYQWQSLAAPTGANPTPQWIDVAGETSQSLNLNNVADNLSGVSYRCVVTCRQSSPNVPAPVVTSNSLTLNVTEPDGSVYVTGSSPDGLELIWKLTGDTLSAAIMARTDNGDPVTYQWYVRSYLAAVPANVNTVSQAAAYLAGAAAEPIEGATGASLTSAPLQEGVYGFSCRVENANNPAKSANSPVIYVRVSNTGIDVEPLPGTIHSVGTVNGQSLTLTASTRVSNVTYTWERYNAASGQWTTLTATGKTMTLPNLTTTATGTLYRCAISVPGSTTPQYTGWYLINVWDTANTPQITYTQPNVQWTKDQLAGNYKDLELKSTAKVAQNTTPGHGLGPVVAVWYNAAGEAVAVNSNDTAYAAALWNSLAPDDKAANSGWFENTAAVSADSGTYTSTLKLNKALTIDENGKVTLAGVSGSCETSATLGRALNGTYYCVWYKPQNDTEKLEETAYTYGYTGTSTNSSVIEKWMHENLYLLSPQGTKGTTKIQIQIPGDPWIVTDLADELSVAVGQKATLSVAAAITPPSDGATPVYTWQVCKNGKWSNCLSTDGTGQFTSTFTTRTITQEDFDSNVQLAYRVIVASRPNVAKILSNTCKLMITEGTPQAPAITPGANSPIKVENGQATGITVSKDGTTVGEFLGQLNMTPVPGYGLRIVGSDGELPDADGIVYTGCVLELVEDATGSVVDMATIIVMGDVLGNGIIGINQVVRMAQDLNGSRPLEGIYEQAGDFNGSGSIDIADLVREAQILSEPVDVQ